MKGLVTLIALFVCLLAVVNATPSAYRPANDNCWEDCSFDLHPVCGFNGKCYWEYSNLCEFRVGRCQGREKAGVEWIRVPLEKCKLAEEKVRPDYIFCHN